MCVIEWIHVCASVCVCVCVFVCVCLCVWVCVCIDRFVNEELFRILLFFDRTNQRRGNCARIWSAVIAISNLEKNLFNKKAKNFFWDEKKNSGSYVMSVFWMRKPPLRFIRQKIRVLSDWKICCHWQKVSLSHSNTYAHTNTLWYTDTHYFSLTHTHSFTHCGRTIFLSFQHLVIVLASVIQTCLKINCRVGIYKTSYSCKKNCNFGPENLEIN